MGKPSQGIADRPSANAIALGSRTAVKNPCKAALHHSSGRPARRNPSAYRSTSSGKLIGEREVMREQITKSRSGGLFAAQNRSVSQSMQPVTESAILPSEIEQLPDRQGYLKLAAQPG